MGVDEVTSELATSTKTGLSPTAASSLLQRDGRNELVMDKGEGVFAALLDKFKDPMILLLLGSAIVSIAVGNVNDATSITLAVLIVTAVGFVQEQRSQTALLSLTKLAPFTCHCVRDGVVETVQAAELVMGDLVVLQVGDRIPADVRLVEVLVFVCLFVWI